MWHTQKVGDKDATIHSLGIGRRGGGWLSQEIFTPGTVWLDRGRGGGGQRWGLGEMWRLMGIQCALLGA